MNSVVLGGHIGNDPKSYTAGNLKIVKVSIGTQRYTKEGNVTDWHLVEIFGKTAEYAEKYFKKGDYILVNGYIATNQFKGRDGQEVRETVVKTTMVEMVSKGAKSSDSSTQEIPPQNSNDRNDNFPF